MIDSYQFLKSVLDTITDHIAVIDQMGVIRFVNKNWVLFGLKNSCLITDCWKNINYIQVCDDSAAMGDEFGLKAAEGIRKVINAEQKLFYLEYPCHSPDEKRWFMMRVTPFQLKGKFFCVISHQNITERKLAEEEVLNLSRVDKLTNLPNRRHFDEFINNEWSRCARLEMPITLAIIDLDYFKLLNDTYGHRAGDECLKKVGAILKQFARRPSDLCGRYGGEEFALVFGNTTIAQSFSRINTLLNTIRELSIPNEKSPIMPVMTASIGLATIYPSDQKTQQELFEAADRLLYCAKKNGRNQVVTQYDG